MDIKYKKVINVIQTKLNTFVCEFSEMTFFNETFFIFLN